MNSVTIYEMLKVNYENFKSSVNNRGNVEC